MGPWLGVDVGGKQKAFDVALVEGQQLVGLRSRQSADDVVSWVLEAKPTVVAIDSPRSCAPDGATYRACEKELRERVCGIRWTPSRDKLQGNPYYEWIVEGRRLYEALQGRPVTVIECFPTASWTRWHGARNGRSRAKWSREALDALGLDGLPATTNQDKRDAIAAAVTAREYERDRCERFGEIVVPLSACRATSR